MENNGTQTMDDWLNEGLDQSVKKAAQTPKTVFPTVPTGVGVPQKPASPPQKPKSLEGIGIGRGGVVRNSTTVVRSSLNNPIATPKNVKSRQSSIIDSTDLPPEFGVPTIMREMDANLEEVTKEKLAHPGRTEQVLPAAPPDELPAQKMITMHSTLGELLEMARNNSGVLKIGARQFSLEIELNQPF